MKLEYEKEYVFYLVKENMMCCVKGYERDDDLKESWRYDYGNHWPNLSWSGNPPETCYGDWAFLGEL